MAWLAIKAVARHKAGSMSINREGNQEENRD